MTMIKDPRFIQAKKILGRSEKTIEPDSLITELFSLHQTRTVSKIATKDFMNNHSRIIDTSVDEISKRSRCTYIKMTALKHKAMLDETESMLRKYLISKYTAYMKNKGYSSIAAQRSYVDSRLKDFSSFVSKLNLVMDTADLVIQDVDAAGWNLKRIADTVAMLHKDR
jgi:hypothetical protein